MGIKFTHIQYKQIVSTLKSFPLMFSLFVDFTVSELLLVIRTFYRTCLQTLYFFIKNILLLFILVKTNLLQFKIK